MKLHNLDVTGCSTPTDVARKNGLCLKGKTLKQVRVYLEENGIVLNKVKKYKWTRSEKACPVCGKYFEVQVGHPKEKVTCSYSCSNTFFRSGKDNPNYKEIPEGQAAYVLLCFRHHQKKCVVCGEEVIVAVHHYDNNHRNNDICNLVPLCPTHHVYIHSRHSHLIQKQVDDYVEDFKNSIKVNPDGCVPSNT